LKLLQIGDKNRDGWISKDEKGRAIVNGLDFGSFADEDDDGKPDLNPILYVWYVDGQGKRIPWARSLKEPGVAGYSFEVQVLGHGQRDRLSHGGVTGTIRAFSAQAFDMHAGLQAHDPTINEERVSLAGAPQFFTGYTRDRGQIRTWAGISLDDPDRDGVVEEISEGDLDLIEWYQLNLPRPAELRRTPRRGRGHDLFVSIGCAKCHVENWTIEAANPDDPDPHRRYAGDRRFFDLQVVENEQGELVGSLKRLSGRKGFEVRGVYSDFRQHDLGEAFHEMQFDGSGIRYFRTSPLWGVGSTAPYGHDGASLSLDAVIRRHGGEALECRKRYEGLSEEERDAVLDFLSSLVLYALDTLPCDVDGDGKIAEHFMVAGRDTGRETFNPEWLFRVPGQVEGWTTAPDGSRVFSRALLNVDEAYGCKLPWLLDRDRSGFPDIVEPLTRYSQVNR
jgi:hypothetical protein